MTATIVVAVGEYVDATQEELKPYLVDWNLAVFADGSAYRLTMQAESQSIPSMWRRIK